MQFLLNEQTLCVLAECKESFSCMTPAVVARSPFAAVAFPVSFLVITLLPGVYIQCGIVTGAMGTITFKFREFSVGKTSRHVELMSFFTFNFHVILSGGLSVYLKERPLIVSDSM